MIVIRDSPVVLARRKETPFIIRALQAQTHEGASRALNEGRVFIEASRQASRDACRARK